MMTTLLDPATAYVQQLPTIRMRFADMSGPFQRTVYHHFHDGGEGVWGSSKLLGDAEELYGDTEISCGMIINNAEFQRAFARCMDIGDEDPSEWYRTNYANITESGDGLIMVLNKVEDVAEFGMFDNPNELRRLWGNKAGIPFVQP